MNFFKVRNKNNIKEKKKNRKKVFKKVKKLKNEADEDEKRK